MQLPRPIVEQPIVGGSGTEIAPTVPEQAPLISEKAPTAQQPSQVTVSPTILPLPPMPPLNVSQDDVSTTTQNLTSTIVDDDDLIEKEWVNKAKQIVERNRDDPYRQSEELTVFRADYMKKRYDKSIKLNQ